MVVVESPAVIRLFGDFSQPANFGYVFALTQLNIGFTQLGNDLIHCMTFLVHSESPFRAIRPSKILSLTMVQFYGGRSSLLWSRYRSQMRLVLHLNLGFAWE